MRTALLSISTLAVSLAATAEPRSPGLEALTAELTAAVTATRPIIAGEVTMVRGDRVSLVPGALPAGTTLELLTEVEPVTDPNTLELLGVVLERCAELTVVDSTTQGSRARVDGGACRPPRPGDRVRTPARAVPVALVRGRATPEVEGLLDLLLAVVRGRLEQTGRFQVVEALATPELTARLSLASESGDLHALLELRDVASGGSQDLSHLVVPAVPEALWRDRTLRAPSPYGRMTATVPGTILALAAGSGPGELLVLSDRALLVARAGDVGSLAVEQLTDLTDLPPAPHPSRVRAGTLVTDDARVCFSTTDLAGGWCLDAGRRSPLAGVPLPGRGGLLLGRWRQGQDVLDGSLRAPDGAPLTQIGPFLALAPSPDGGHVVQRTDGRLERLDDAFAPGSTLPPRSGDAWLLLPNGDRLQSQPVPWGAPDHLDRWREGRAIASQPVAGAVVALAALDTESGRFLALATAVPNGPSRLTLQPMP